MLILYFSHSGNTRTLAEYIHSKIGGDILELKTVSPYPSDYDAVVDQAQQEQRQNARPEISTSIPDLEKYDTVFIGYPNWWGTMPMCMFTLLEKYDLSGKTIIPFCTNEGSGMGSSERDLKNLCKGATVKAGLSVHGAEAAESESKVAAWAKKSV